MKPQEISDFNAIILQSEVAVSKATADTKLYVPLDTRVYGLDSAKYLTSSANVHLNGAHATVKLWNRGGYAGVLVLKEEDVPEFLEKLGLVPA